MKKLKLISVLFAFLLFACGEEATPTDDCPEELLCTEEFRSLTFSPRENEQFVVLDSYYTLNLDNGETYNYEGQHDPLVSQFYVIISDAEMDQVAKDGTNVRFIGVVGSTPVIEQDFVVGHDCCHVIGIEGPFGGL